MKWSPSGKNFSEIWLERRGWDADDQGKDNLFKEIFPQTEIYQDFEIRWSKANRLEIALVKNGSPKGFYSAFRYDKETERFVVNRKNFSKELNDALGKDVLQLTAEIEAARVQAKLRSTARQTERQQQQQNQPEQNQP